MLLHQACCICAVSIRQVRVCADNTVSDRCWRIRSGSFCNLQYEIIQHLLIKLCYRLKLLNSIIQKRYLKHIFLFMKENFNLSFSKFKIRNYLSIVSSWMDKEGGGVGRPLLPGWPTAENGVVESTNPVLVWSICPPPPPPAETGGSEGSSCLIVITGRSEAGAPLGPPAVPLPPPAFDNPPPLLLFSWWCWLLCWWWGVLATETARRLFAACTAAETATFIPRNKKILYFGNK